MTEVEIGRAPVEDSRPESVENGQTKARIIDADVHEMLVSIRDLLPYLSEPWHDRIAVADGWKGISPLPYSYPQIGGVAMAEAATDNGGPAGSDPELMRQQLLDRYSVERAVLVSMFHPSDMYVQPEFATALASAYNDWLYENWLLKDERLLGSVTIAVQEPEAAAHEIDRVGSDPRFVQVILPASPRDVFGRSFYHPVFEAAQRNGLAIAFHQSWNTATAVGLPPYYIEWHTAISQAWQSQLIGLISHGVFDKFEELKVAMLESSWTWLPHLMWRFDYNYRSLRREVPWVKRLPSQYIRERVKFSTQPMEYPEDPDDLYRMFEMVGSEDFLMFSTDYPHWDFDSPEQALPVSFPRQIRQKIFADNARDFYGL